MADNNENISQEEALEKLSVFVVERMKAGESNSEISQKLVGMGVETEHAERFVEEIYAETLAYADQTRFTLGSAIPAIGGAGLAAIFGGIVWGVIAIVSGYEIGYVAWGIGALAGYAVVLSTSGKRGFPLQAIAIVASIVGIALGKYVTFFHYVKEAVGKEYGAQAASQLSVFSGSVIQYFGESAGSMLTGYDALWVILAVLTAWRIPKGIGFKAA